MAGRGDPAACLAWLQCVWNIQPTPPYRRGFFFLKDGFAVRVFPSGKKFWGFLYTVDGRKRRLTLGSWETLSLAEARIKHGEA